MRELTFEALKAHRDALFNELMCIPMEWAGKDATYWNRLKRRFHNIQNLLFYRKISAVYYKATFGYEADESIPAAR